MATEEVNNAPQTTVETKKSVESLRSHLTDVQFAELKEAYKKAMFEETEKRLIVLKSSLSDGIEEELDKKDPKWTEIIEEKELIDKAGDTFGKALDKAENIPIVGAAVSVLRRPGDTAEGIEDKVLTLSGLDKEFTVNNSLSSVFKEKGIWEGIKYIFQEIKTIFSAGFSLDAFSRVLSFFKGEINTGKKVSELVSYYDSLLDLQIFEEAIWKNAMLDKELLDIPLETLRKNAQVTNIAEVFNLDDISHDDAKKFLDKFFETSVFDKIITDYKSRANITEIDEKTLTLKDIFLQVLK